MTKHPTSVQHRLKDREELLSPFATRANNSRGRRRREEPSLLRTEFQRDRDRIIHTKAFRRLKHKTQVFLAPLGDHYVTRLTHTLEVTQIARTIARALNLNEDLTEAIGLGHDLGHTPFGHIGEDMLDQLFHEGFKHNHQSLRIVETLEKDGEGLNLTWEVGQGMVRHSKPRGDFLADTTVYAGEEDLTLEAQICRISDAVAYVNHDLADAFRAGVLSEVDLPEEVAQVLGTRHSERIDSLVSDVVGSSWPATGEEPTPPGSTPEISMSGEVRGALYTLREFLFEKVYIPAGQGEEGRAAREVMEVLYHHYSKRPDEIPVEYKTNAASTERATVDYIAGMTDRYALRIAENIRPGITAPFVSRLI